MPKSKPTGFAWHVHHGVLYEPLTEPLSVRRKYIRDHKPASEVGIRLRLLKPIRGPLPALLVKAGAAYNKMQAAYTVAQAAYDEASVAHHMAPAEAEDQMAQLHATECPNCPWDGSTIFPQEPTS